MTNPNNVYVVILRNNKNQNYDIMKFSDWINKDILFQLNNPIQKSFDTIFQAYNYAKNINKTFANKSNSCL